MARHDAFYLHESAYSCVFLNEQYAVKSEVAFLENF